MPHRLDIELTAKQSDDLWSWRAAGARQPKGTVSSRVLYDGASVGDVVKAEADFTIDGIDILSVSRPTKKQEKPVERIEIKGTGRTTEGVTTSLVSKREKRKGPPRRGRERDGNERGDKRESRSRRETREREPRPRGPRLMPKMKHRGAILDSLEGQQRRIGELLLRGGMQSVRAGLEEDGIRGPEQTTLLTAAEDLWPKLKTADWMDRAEAALEMVDTLSLRDLRAIVATGDANARTDEARELARQLRESVDKRSSTERDNWLAEIESSLNDGRIIRALRLTSRPPDPAIKFPAELAQQLTDAAGAALSSDIEVDRWLSVLDAVANSSVRRSVKPAGLPADKDDPRLAEAKSAASKVPALAQLFGLSIPPPPTGRRLVPPRPRAERARRPRKSQGDEIAAAKKADAEEKPVETTSIEEAEGPVAEETLAQSETAMEHVEQIETVPEQSKPAQASEGAATDPPATDSNE